MQNSVQDTTILDYKAVNYINGCGDRPLFMRTSSGWRYPANWTRVILECFNDVDTGTPANIGGFLFAR